MTRSARGTLETPGRNVVQKAGLNRSTLDAAPAVVLNMLRYKAEEAGSEFFEARPKPSQRCPDCGTLCNKGLSERQHRCGCGCSLGRDKAAARVLLQWGLQEAQRLNEERMETISTAGTVVGQAAA